MKKKNKGEKKHKNEKGRNGLYIPPKSWNDSGRETAQTHPGLSTKPSLNKISTTWSSLYLSRCYRTKYISTETATEVMFLPASRPAGSIAACLTP